MTMLQTPAEALMREAYLAMMWALSYPGQAHPLPPAANDFVTVGNTLLDLETSFFCSDDALAMHLRETGARMKPAHEAAYLFLPHLHALDVIADVRLGDFQYPDAGATLVIGCDFDASDAGITTWRGPGIAVPRRVLVGGLPAGFWALREQLIRYPLGFDVFFVGRGQVMGLPRTTEVIGNQ
jgi:alpha-D-ribose 1-methylphosphonate 5-triphosphate synthase subunit PhnH